jgi:hypothetical protein
MDPSPEEFENPVCKVLEKGQSERMCKVNMKT